MYYKIGVDNLYDYTKIEEKIRQYNEEEKILLKNINYFNVGKKKKREYWVRLIDIKCYKQELLEKKMFIKELERCMKNDNKY